MSSDHVQAAADLARHGRISEAVRRLETAGNARDPAALAELAVWHLRGDVIPRDLAAARFRLRQAAEAGHVDAALMQIALTANGGGAPPDWSAALALLDRAAASDPVAAAQLAMLCEMALNANGAPTRLPVGEVLAVSPRVVRFRDFTTPGEREHLARVGHDLLEPATVFDPTTGRQIAHPVRTSHGGAIGPTREDLVVQAINRRIAAASGTDVRCGEPLTVLRYQPGQEYRMHHDAIGRTDNDRGHTLLLYLNDGFAGGATNFPDLSLTITPQAGDALLFSNLSADGRPDPRARHAGLPVTAGVKWLATRWIRERPLDLWNLG